MTPEEAQKILQSALDAEVRRLPQLARSRFSDTAKMAADFYAGRPNQSMDALRYYNGLGHPDYEPADDEQRQLQEELLTGYTGRGWTPEQRKALGRDPQPYEYSPGGRILRDIEARRSLFDRIEKGQGKKLQTYSYGMGSPNPADFADPLTSAAYDYQAEIERDKAHAMTVQSLSNPENFVGSYMTKMGPVLSDAGALLATERNTGGSGLNALGDAAARAYGADWNRTSPQLVQDRGWQDNDALIRRMRQAFHKSEPQSSGDTFRSWTGGHVPYIQPLINGAMSFANGLLDMSAVAAGPGAVLTKGMASQAARSGVPLVKGYGNHLVRQINKDLAAMRGASMAGKALNYSKREVGDELMDVGNVVNTGAQFVVPDPNETDDQFKARTAAQAKVRSQATKELEANQNQIIRPKGMVERVTEPVGKAIGGFFNNLIY